MAHKSYNQKKKCDGKDAFQRDMRWNISHTIIDEHVCDGNYVVRGDMQWNIGHTIKNEQVCDGK